MEASADHPKMEPQLHREIYSIYVYNLPPDATWQWLKDIIRSLSDRAGYKTHLHYVYVNSDSRTGLIYVRDEVNFRQACELLSSAELKGCRLLLRVVYPVHGSPFSQADMQDLQTSSDDQAYPTAPSVGDICPPIITCFRNQDPYALSVGGSHLPTVPYVNNLHPNTILTNAVPPYYLPTPIIPVYTNGAYATSNSFDIRVSYVDTSAMSNPCPPGSPSAELDSLSQPRSIFISDLHPRVSAKILRRLVVEKLSIQDSEIKSVFVSHVYGSRLYGIVAFGSHVMADFAAGALDGVFYRNRLLKARVHHGDQIICDSESHEAARDLNRSHPPSGTTKLGSSHEEAPRDSARGCAMPAVVNGSRDRFVGEPLIQNERQEETLLSSHDTTSV